MRWVRSSTLTLDSKIPRMVMKYVLNPMIKRDGDGTTCDYYRGIGTCSYIFPCTSPSIMEPMCQTMTPIRGWPIERLTRGICW